MCTNPVADGGEDDREQILVTRVKRYKRMLEI